MKKNQAAEGIYDATTLGTPRMMLLGIQHMFAMFGATVLVPQITGLSVSSTLLFAGLGTLLFHFLTKGKVPAFLGSSFAFLAGYQAIAPSGEKELLPYACVGVACSALLYFILAALVKSFGANRVLRFVPHVVTGPIIIAIGLTLSQSAVENCSVSWLVALTAIVIVVVCNVWGKGMIRVIPIILGAVGSYLMAILLGQVDFAAIQNAPWVGLPVQYENTVFAVLKNPNRELLITSIITIMPIAIATMMEHIGDIAAISSTVDRNYFEDPGLHRTLLGDGLATLLASLFGAPANTTYGENTGVMTLTKVYDPKVVRIAAYLAILLSFSPKFSALISSMPAATIGGVSIVLYGMISAVGIRNMVENEVDFKQSRNVIIAALVMVLSIGIKYSSAGAINLHIGSVTVGLSGLAVGSLVGILLNVILPEEDGKEA